MSKSTGNKSGGARKGGGGSPLLTGILVGMVIGVALAAGLAWFIMKSPSPFVQNEPVTVKPPVAAKPQAQPAAVVPGAAPGVAPRAPSASAPVAAPASGVSGDKPRFEFYKVLTDKQDAAVTSPAKPAEKTQPENKPVAAVSGPQFLQAGSFSNVADAEKVKARLAMIGMEASIQTATIPEKGVWHRVRLGPYKNAEEMNKVRATLKQNGIEATPIRAQ